MPTTPERVADTNKIKEYTMITILIFVLAVVLLDMAAMRWGVNSTEDINSREWDRRAHWGEKTSEQVEAY